MLQTLSIKPTPGRRVRPQKFSLSYLPREIQLRIFEFALIECPKWEKKHNADCRFKPSDINNTEIPVFLNLTIRIWLTGDGEWRQHMSSNCRCAKRRGLGLLLASRGMHQLAAPIFWSQNTFCFLDAMEFLATIGHTLRDECRGLIQSVSLLNPDATAVSNHISLSYNIKRDKAHMDAFWATIMKCERLVSLELPPPYINPDTFGIEKWNLLAEELPALTAIRLSYLLPYTNAQLGWGRPSQWRYFQPGYSCPGQQDVFVHCSRTLPLRQEGRTLKSATEFYRAMEFNFKIHVDTVIKIKYLNADPERLADYHSTFKLLPGLDEYNSTCRITLPTRETTTIKFYGLPISKSTRIQQSRGKEAMRQRQASGLTRSQVEEQKQRKKEIKKQDERNKMRERDDELKGRRARRNQMDDAEATTVKKQNKKIIRLDRERKEQRKLERKRRS